MGGAVGAMLRYLTVALVGRLAGSGFPYGTMLVNGVGSFLMGIAVVVLVARAGSGIERIAPFLLPGLLGGFTTFSAYSLEVFALAEAGRLAASAAYAAGSVALGLGALGAGVWLARGWFGA